MSNIMKKSLTLVVFIGSLVLYQNCGTGFGNPNVSQSMDVAFSSFKNKSSDNSENNGNGVSDLIICIKKFKFTARLLVDNVDGDKIEYKLGEVELLPQGTPLGDLLIPVGVYEKIELELDGKSCESGLATQFNNKFGSFSYERSIKVKYEGEVFVNENYNAIRFGVQPLVKALDKVKENSEVKKAMEEVTLVAESLNMDPCVLDPSGELCEAINSVEAAEDKKKSKKKDKEKKK